MNEFDMETKVRMMFALSAAIDARFLAELKKVAEVEVDEKRRIIQYKQNDGGLELNVNCMTRPMKQGEQKVRKTIQFLAEKSKTTDKPIADTVFLREFKEKTACPDTIGTLRVRYRHVKNTIYQSSEIEKNTRIKMMFISNAKLSDDVLAELRKDADVGVDEEGRITKYEANDGSLNLKGNHGMSSIKKSFYSNRWHTISEKVNEVDTEKDDEKDANWQKDYEQKRIELVRFLIERTKNATSPLNIKQLVKDYKAEFKNSEPPETTVHRIRSFRQRIHEMNQFDISTKVKLIFALSASIDDQFLIELQKDAIVELDGNQRIKKYDANDGSLILKGDHSMSAKTKAVLANRKTARVVNDSSESEDDRAEEDSSKSDESEEEASTSSSVRKSDRLRKSSIFLQNKNKKRQLSEKNFDSAHTRNHAKLFRGKKRARISYSSTEEEPSEEGEDEESMPSDGDSSMKNKNNNVENGGDGFDYDTPINNYYDEDLEHNVTDRNLERNIETPEARDDVEEEEGKKEEESSESSSAKIESMSFLELLNHLRSPIAQYTPALVHRMNEKIKKLEEKDKQIPFNIILESLEMCIQFLNTLEEMDSDEDTTSLPNFFYRLGTAMCTIKHPMMNDFYLKIKKLACTRDKKVSLEHIRYVMGKTLDRILN